ncbi:MAG: hypothetical protein A2046_17095 [Bacteroidetes bacterium GWA2_30_7]|nr:MAG: hypothetical protein A2046_17095 [Bacteroidetes bacterium GWA2_30_7]
MKIKNFRSKINLFVLCLVMQIIFFGCINDKSHDEKEFDVIKIDNGNDQKINVNEFSVSPPPFSEDIFPCSACHADQIPSAKRRTLDMHEDIQEMFNHDSENRWCIDCHDLNSRDSLKLASGKLIGFDESFKLCGQCHGDKYRDWKVGVHGKRIGEWNGKKQYFLCVHCHNPHSPKFNPLKPMPAPVRQEDLQ